MLDMASTFNVENIERLCYYRQSKNEKRWRKRQSVLTYPRNVWGIRQAAGDTCKINYWI